MFQVAIACLSLWKPGFGSTVAHVDFVVDRWHRDRIFHACVSFPVRIILL